MAIVTLDALGAAGAGSGLTKGKSMAIMPSGAPSPAIEGRFLGSMTNATGISSTHATSQSSPMKTMFSALDQVNGQAKSVSQYAAEAEASGGQLTPGEIVQLTMRCNEFMFQCQLTSNIANRSSDGVQQLFRQQG
jgi:hypothetical protein